MLQHTISKHCLSPCVLFFLKFNGRRLRVSKILLNWSNVAAICQSLSYKTWSSIPPVGVRGMGSAKANFLTGSREFRSYAKWCQCTFTIFTCVRFYAKASQNDRFTISTLEKQINCDYWTWFISAWHVINGAYVSTTRYHSMLKVKPIYIESLWLKNFAARYSTATRSLPPYIEFCFKFLLKFKQEKKREGL